MDNFYGTVAAADDYHAARGNTAWAAGSTEGKAAALVRASSYVDSLANYQVAPPFGAWSSRFSGVKTGGRAQELAWPRTGASDNEGNAIPANEVPREVEQATYEAALRELVAPGSLSPDYVASAVVKREKVDVLETEFAVSATAGAANITPVVQVILALLAPLFSPDAYDVGLIVV